MGSRHRLREAVLEFQVSLLTYNITGNHVHLVAYAEAADQIAGMMQQAAGAFARDYNRRKSRSGAFWEGRYHATMIDSGQYLWACLKYVELNMVRCGVVRHPRDCSVRPAFGTPRLFPSTPRPRANKKAACTPVGPCWMP